MGTILIVDNDPVFGAVLEDRLHVAGHEIRLFREREKALEAAVTSPADLLIFEIGQPGNVGLEALNSLREKAETRTLPILVLSESVESSDRVAALRAGADDYLTKPCDFEELLLRAERLLGSRAAPQPVLQGDLANHPLWELVQFLQHAGQSGSLVLRSPSGTGRVRVRGGKLLSARWEKLPPSEALLAIFGLKKGSFRFVSEAEEAVSEGEVLATNEILMDAAWIEDELEKRRVHLPVSGTPLKATSQDLPADSEDFESGALPLDEVLREVGKKAGTRLFDLIRQLPWAPQKIRLAVAFLVEKGVLETPQGIAAQAYPTTSEIASTQLTEMAVNELLSASRHAGFGTSALPFLILFETGNWSPLLEILENVPGFHRNEPMRELKAEVQENGSGCASFPVDLGKLALHIKALQNESREEIETTVTVSAGVFLWLDNGEEPALAEAVIERLEALRNPARGVVVATHPEVLKLARRWTRGKKRWQTSSHAPQSLLGVFRLLQPTAE